ncbi:MAG TPA: ABC transporter ATP-binding protein [Candidatus Paceibacterota bacterium]
MPTGKKQLLIPGLKIVWKYVSRYKRELTFVIVLGVIIALVDGITPYLGGKLIDSLIKPYKLSLLGTVVYAHVWLLAAWGVAQAFMHVTSWIGSKRSQAIGRKLLTNYISDGFSHLLEVPMAFHKSRKIGDIQERIQRAASELHDIVSDIVTYLGPQILTFVVATLISFYINWILGIVLLAGVLIYASLMLVLLKPVINLNKKRNKAFREGWNNVFEALGNVLAVKQATTEKVEKQKITRSFNVGAYGAWMRVFELWQNLYLIQRVIILLTQVTVYIISIIKILDGTMTVGQLVMFNGYAAMMFGPFITLGKNWSTIQSGIISVEQAEGLVTHPKEDYAGKTKIAGPIDGDVEFKNVSFRYERGKEVLNDISFKANAGEVVALVGESGVGKSTLIDLISGYYSPSKGAVTIDGVKVKDHNLHRLRSNIAVVSQEIVLFNDTIYNNIRYGNFNTSPDEVVKAAEKANVSEFVDKFPKKWKQIVGERGIKLSVGQKQRVAIARAILRNPRILILDEPTSALDAKAESIIQESLVELMEGKTTFVIAHRLSTVRNADKIIVIKDGKIVEQGKHDELIQIPNGEYRHLYELQIGLHS